MADQAQASAVNRRLTCSQPIGTWIYSCYSPGFQSKWYAVPKPENQAYRVFVCKTWHSKLRKSLLGDNYRGKDLSMPKPTLTQYWNL
jgi:hypothetical protein